MVHARRSRFPLAWTAAALAMGAGCANIAGLDGNYTIGDVGTGGSGNAAGSGGSGNAAAMGGTGPDGGAAGTGGSAGTGGGPGCLGSGGRAPCADAACADVYECAPAIPSGFSGPYRVSSVAADPTPTPLACDDGSSPELFFRGSGDPATCTACGCDASPASCSLPTVRYFNNSSSCGGTSSVITPSGSCQSFADTCNACNRARSVRLESASQGQGSCTPSGGTAQLPAMWQLENHLCFSGADAGGCATAGEVCIPTGAGTYASPPCITQAGAQTCPAAYPERYILYTGGTDTRDCAACGCDPPTCTAGTFTLYDVAGCTTGGESPLTVGATCSGDIRSWVDGGVASYQAAAGTLQGCTATGGTPTGEVSGSGETTLCCTAPIVDP